MTKNIVKLIEQKEWVKRWAGSYTFISASYWGKQYKTSLERELGISFDHSLFVHKKGTVSFYLIKNELDNFGNTLAKQATKNNKIAIKWCGELKKNADLITKIMKNLQDKIPSQAEYQKFLIAFDRHLPLHNAMKKTVDYFSIEVLDKLLPYFKDARLYTEHVYSDTESFFRSVTKKIAEKEKYNSDYLTCLTQSEFETYLQTKKLPNEKILRERFKSSVLYFENAKEYIETGKQTANIEKAIFRKSIQGKKEIKGISAYNGTAIGTARIIPDPHQIGIFNEGDILITGMTRPEFLPIMKKASAVVTDAGGILCHAAISARELKIPCVVGTQLASSIFHDGEKIKVDANTGIISLIK
jgi:phosphohistidine swiveling domain-containing protein